MRSDELRAIDEAAVPRPWKWTDDTLLWNEEVDHCVLGHDDSNWSVTPENRAAIASAMNHMPALVTLVSACEHRRRAIDVRREFGERAYATDPFSIMTSEFREQVARLDRAIRDAERAVDSALTAVHDVTAIVPDDRGADSAQP